MCGICGFVSYNAGSMEMLRRMNNTLMHRGPDDHGEEIYQAGGHRFVGFAQRRLSIVDLSFNGHQPMHSVNKRVSVIFNGEIYNFPELKKELNEYPFSSECDTEVIIAAYLKWGIHFVDKINGMFAIALFDRNLNEVFLIRDRIGKKPLYYYWDKDNNIVFASELKAILQADLFKQELNTEVIGRFLYRSYINAPATIYKNVYKLEPGTILKITERGINKYKYWDISSIYHELSKQKIDDYEQAKQQLKELLKNAVSRRMIADVPLGAFLSGGYDSSLICAIAQELSKDPIKTFSIGFEDPMFNEAHYAKHISEVLGTNHTDLYMTETEMLTLLDSIPKYYDEPFADSSQIPTMFVSQLAKKQVSVVLSGDGGDELFGGYGIYSVLQQVQQKEAFRNCLYRIGKLPGIYKTSWWKKRSIVMRLLSDDNNNEARTQSGVNSYFNQINKLLLLKKNNFYYEWESRYQEKRYDITRMLLDMDTYLPDDILTKVDRASMRYALECRCPILDKEVIEYSFKLLPDFKDDHGNQKRILKDITYEYIPKQIMERPKTGFAIPLDKWLRGSLKEKILDWTSSSYLKKQGIFDSKETCLFVNEYMEKGDQGKWSGQNYSRIIWAYFIFQQWYEEYNFY